MKSVRLHFAANGEDIELFDVKFKDELAFLMKVAASLSWWTSTLRRMGKSEIAMGWQCIGRVSAALAASRMMPRG